MDDVEILESLGIIHPSREATLTIGDQTMTVCDVKLDFAKKTRRSCLIEAAFAQGIAIGGTITFTPPSESP